MSLRMPTFICRQQHLTEVVVDKDVASVQCARCGGVAVKALFGGGAPGVKSGERVSKDEVRQYLAQFGEIDPKTKKWKFVPQNRDELNVALRQHNAVPISTREFETLADQKAKLREEKLASAPTPVTTERGQEFMKRRREWFRTAYDNGYRPHEPEHAGADKAFYERIGAAPVAPKQEDIAEAKKVATVEGAA